MSICSKLARATVTPLYVLLPILALGQTQTTGRIAGTVRDAHEAVIAGADVAIENPATADKHLVATDNAGNYSVSLLPPAIYDLSIRSRGFTTAVIHNVSVGLSETTIVNATLRVAQASVEVTVGDAPPLVRSDSSELSATIESRGLTVLPLPTRNFLQLLALAPGVAASLTNNSAVGRNSPNISVNGARVTQNSYQINGVDANNISMHDFGDVAVPAPESISEVKMQTSMYDASVGGAGGGSVQVVTKSGSNLLHGSVYEYFQNEALNGNDPNLIAVGSGRPVMRRNVYGATLGGPVRQNKAFFFVSYQGAREANGATNQSLYKDVLIDPKLTDDRSEAALLNTYFQNTKTVDIDRVALALLNTKLSNGQFLIPTPQTPEGGASGTALSTYREEQFNSNFDYRLSSRDSVAAKFFFANAPLFSALRGSDFGTAATLPGFGTQVDTNNRVLSLEEIHTFSPTALNEARFGYNFIRHDELPQEPIRDSDIGIQRSTATEYPGLPLILLAREDAGASIGTSDITLRSTAPSLSLIDVASLQRRTHNIRFGGELRHSEWRVPSAGVFSYGEIDFAHFTDFLTGTSEFSHIGIGLPHRDFLSTDYHLFIQDDWRISSKFTVNLGLRYELDLPPYDSEGRIGGFDPSLYRPRMEVDSDGLPVGPPVGGIVEAGDALPQYSLPGVPRVGKRMVKSVDPNNFGPRIGMAWSPLASGKLAIRAGYGIFYSRPSFSYLAFEYFAPPFFLDAVSFGQPLDNPFANAPPESSFPLIQPGVALSGTVLDRNLRTPYIQHFNTSVQHELLRDTTLQVAYVGSRGVNLFRTVFTNQARIASIRHPIVNAVTGEAITINSSSNAPLRAPMQGVDPSSFALNESTAQSTYHSLQATLNRRYTRGLQLSASYTFSRSIDNGSNPGGGASSDGSLDTSGDLDTSTVWGNQLSARANRGLSDFDRTHHFVASYVWDLPEPAFAHGSRVKRLFFSSWQLSGIMTAMSGLPVDIFDPAGGSLYGLFGARPDWAPGANRRTATRNIPSGYYFNPSAFAGAIVQVGQPIPSAHDPTALAGATESDIGNLGRNVLRGPAQSNVDFSVGKHIALGESRTLVFRADFFNLLNHANHSNPISDISASDFGRVVAFSTGPRIVQVSLKFGF